MRPRGKVVRQVGLIELGAATVIHNMHIHTRIQERTNESERRAVTG